MYPGGLFPYALFSSPHDTLFATYSLILIPFPNHHVDGK